MPEQHNIEWKQTWRDEYLKWGRGIAKEQEVCRAQGYPEPEFELLGEDMTVTFHASDSAKTAITAFTSEQASDKSVQALGKSVQASDKSVQALGASVQASKRERIQLEILSFCEEERCLTVIAAKLGMRHLSYLRKVYISPLLSEKKLEMTHPENPRHMRQQYRTSRIDEYSKLPHYDDIPMR